MTHINRRQVLVQGTALMAAPALVLPRYANAAEFTYKFGTNVPATHPLNVRAMEACERILKETNGQVQINVFPNNQLGNDADMLSQLRAGGLEFFTVSGVNVLSQLVPSASMWGLGFAWSSEDAVHKALDGELGRFLRAQFPKVGLMALDTVWSSGFRQMTNSVRPINSPEDLKGLKMRVPVSPLWTSLFKHLGASPASMSRYMTCTQRKWSPSGWNTSRDCRPTAGSRPMRSFSVPSAHKAWPIPRSGFLWRCPWLLASPVCWSCPWCCGCVRSCPCPWSR